jgi:hypothetical protein
VICDLGFGFWILDFGGILRCVRGRGGGEGENKEVLVVMGALKRVCDCESK